MWNLFAPQHLGLRQRATRQADPGEVLGTQWHSKLGPDLQKLTAWCEMNDSQHLLLCQVPRHGANDLPTFIDSPQQPHEVGIFSV